MLVFIFFFIFYLFFLEEFKSNILSDILILLIIAFYKDQKVMKNFIMKNLASQISFIFFVTIEMNHKKKNKISIILFLIPYCKIL